MPFAQKLVDLYLDLVTSPRGQAPYPDPVPPALQSYQCLPEDCEGLRWAQLDAVYNYLRRGKDLEIPAHWRRFVPPPAPENPE